VEIFQLILIFLPHTAELMIQ